MDEKALMRSKRPSTIEEIADRWTEVRVSLGDEKALMAAAFRDQHRSKRPSAIEEIADRWRVSLGDEKALMAAAFRDQNLSRLKRVKRPSTIEKLTADIKAEQERMDEAWQEARQLFMERPLDEESAKSRSDRDGLRESEVFSTRGRVAESAPVALFEPPGSRIARIAEFSFSLNTFETVFQPITRDLQDEYFEALATRRLWKARYIHLRGVCAFWTAVWAQCSGSLFRTLLKTIGVG